MDPKKGFWRRFAACLVAFLEHPIQVTRHALISIWRVVPPWLYRQFRRFCAWIAILPRSRALHIALAVCILICLAYSALFYWIEQQVPVPEPVDQYVYLNQGWGDSGTSADRMLYYYTAQGARVRDIRYDWFVNLERPWKRDRFANPVYMRGYGFIVDTSSQTNQNPDNLPIGFSRQWDSHSATMMLDLTCAACHTGELQVVKDNKRTAVRIDGGPAMQAVTSTKPGSFGIDVLASLLATAINPAKWSRFAGKILPENHSLRDEWDLWTDVVEVIYKMVHQAAIEKRLHLYPVEEGFGRTDALGRIANNVFATNLNPKNYKVANAPVSYPAVWDAWKFDWVQYTASVAQPLARNIGESLGTGAEYDLLDRYGKPVESSQQFRSSTYVPELIHIEDTLQKLNPPVWDEKLFGPKDVDKYNKGRALFMEHCQHCHGPYYASCAKKQIDAPLKDSARDHWKMTTIPLQDIGTDPTAAINFVNNRYDLSTAGIDMGYLRKVLALYYVEKFRRIAAYCDPDGNKAICSKTEDAGNAEDNNKTVHPKPVCDDTTDIGSPACKQTMCKKTICGKTENSYAQENLSSIDLSNVSSGEGLNYIIALIRQVAYQDMDMANDLHDREVRDGFGQLDIPQVIASYRAKPLQGIWATAPFLHNGSVPNLYEMLLPANQRSKKFYLKGRTFDPVKVGLVTNPTDPAAFLYDTTIPGNSNAGHEFRAGYRGPWKEGDPPSWGVIGPELTEEERWSIIEFLKFMKNEDVASPFGKESPAGCPAPAKEAAPRLLDEALTNLVNAAIALPAPRTAAHSGGAK